MPALFGRSYGRAELERRVGRTTQIGGITPFEFVDGRGRGVRAFDVATGSGFAFTAVADRALDVASATFDGIPLCWQSQNEIAAPEYYEPAGNGWLRTFFGGLFTTCGLTNFGPPGSDRWGPFGLHGRINATPAANVRCETFWEGDSCILELSGTMRQTRVFGEDIRLERRLRTMLGSNRLELHDTVTNDGGERVPHMILYHCNGGFPILDDEARLHVSHSTMEPRDDEARRGLELWDRGGPPTPGFAEQVFIHRPERCSEGRAAAVLANRTLRDGRGLALAIRFDPLQLPALFTWRMLGSGTYVMGMEPANCATIEGREAAEKRGTLPFLEPGESRHYDLEFEAIDREETLDALLAEFP